MALAFVYLGDKSYGGTSLLNVPIGGTAAAGDILFVNAVGGVDGAGLGAMALYDNIDGAGTNWHRIVDEIILPGPSNTYTNHPVIAWKLCTGGETSITIDYAGGTNKALECLWIQDAASAGFTDCYLLGDGTGVFNPSSGHIEQACAPPGTILSNGEVYVGFTTSGRDGYTYADLNINSGSHGADAGGGQDLGGAVKCIIHHWYGGGAGLTSDNVAYGTNIYNNPWMGAAAVRAGTPPVEAASDGGLLLGDAAPLLGLSGASDGGLLLGDADPSVNGGDQQAASHGGLIIGTGRGTIVLPFPPVPPVPAMTGILGCGIYDCFIFTRGLGTIVGRIPFNLLSWSRVLDATSQAQVTVNGVSNTGPMQSCCQLLGSITPYEHEIGIYRDGLRVWSGPVLDIKFPSETVEIFASDLSAWLAVRWLHENHNDVQQDLADIWAEYVADAMAVENSAGLYATVQALTGVLADRLYTQDMGTFAADAIAELARTGLDWTCVDRKMTGGPVPVQPASYPNAPAIPTLVDESFREAPEVDRNGDLMGDAWFVGGSGAGPGGSAIFGQYGPHFPATDDHVESPAAPDYAAIEAQYGRIERRVNETKILDQPSIDQNAATRYDLTKRPVDIISSGTLLPTAGIDIRQLTPGSVQNIHLQRACVQIGAPYRLKALTVTANGDGSEDVVGSWEPLGSTAAHEDL